MFAKLAEESTVRCESVYHTVEGPEQRNRTRLQLHWPVTFCVPRLSDPVETTTQNLSSDGFYCFARIAFVPGELLICTIRVPSHQRNSSQNVLLLGCRVRIVRVEATQETGFYGMGCQIEDYWVLNGPQKLSCRFPKGWGRREAPLVSL